MAVRAACRYVEAGIRTAPGFGKGNGPLNHFHSTYTLPFSPYVLVFPVALDVTDQAERDRFVEWVLQRPDVAPVWERFVNHPFVMAMGNGSLPLESFKGYLVQDYLYLVGIPSCRCHLLIHELTWFCRHTLPGPTPWQLTSPRTWKI